MSNYTKATNFTAKDSLITGDPSKKVLGSELDTEYTAIETAIQSKADIASPTFTGTVTLPTVAGNRTDSGNVTRTGTTTMSGKSLWEAEGASVASANDCNIWTTDGNTVHVTGTTQINDWGTAPQAGAWKRVIFDGALVINYDATTNDLPGDTDVTTVAGDSCIVYARSTSSYQIFDYTRADGSALTSAPKVIESGNLPAANELQITNIPQIYSAILLKVNSASCDTDTRRLFIHASVNNGSSYDTMVGNYLGSHIQAGAATANSTPSLIAPEVHTAAETESFATIIHGYSSGPFPLAITNGKSSSQFTSFITYVGSTSGINALKIIWDSTGNFDGGTYALYGIL